MSKSALSALPTQEDYRRYDRIWQRVSGELDPYPEVRAAQCCAPDAPPQPCETDAPCCMGGAAREELGAIRGFLRDALADAHTYCRLAACAPTAEGRRLMRRLAAEEEARVKTLRAVHFLITGECYDVTVVLPPQPRMLWCEHLRARWHAEVCGGFNCARAAGATEDPCLRRIFERLSRDEYRHAELLLRLIEKTL